MLTVTHTAAQAIDAIIAAAPDVPETGGLRIAQSVDSDGRSALALSLVDAPEATDQVVDSERGSVFVESGAAALLDDKVLDAEVEGGEVGFTLSEQDR